MRLYIKMVFIGIYGTCQPIIQHDSNNMEQTAHTTLVKRKKEL
jgi:hypothetical protein